MPDLPEKTAPILEATETLTVPARAEPFVVRDRFERPQGIVLSTVWSEFKSRFYGKTEAPAPEFRIRKYKLLAISPDGPIIDELGGEARVEGTLAAAYALLRGQGRGQAGILQNNGYANIFYVKDLKDVLCAVRIGWDEDGWVIDAIPVKDPLAWNGKHEIFCPVPAEGPA
jgi:hypothetical protein